MPFRFRLGPVRRLREAERDELRGRLADAHRAADVLRREREKLGRELAELREYRLAAASKKAMNVAQVVESQRYERVLEGQQAGLVEKEKLVEQEIARRQAAVAQAERRVKTYDKLEEKQRRSHQEESNRTANKELDEIAQVLSLRGREERRSGTR